MNSLAFLLIVGWAELFEGEYRRGNSILLNYYFGEHQWVPEEPTIGG